MCKHDHLNWKEMGIISSLADKITDAERECDRIQELIEAELNEDPEDNLPRDA